MKEKLFFILIALFFSSLLFTQNLSIDIPQGGVILEGKIKTKEAVWAKDRSIIYTINWFSLDVIYDGNFIETKEIPIITLGGGDEFEFAMVNHGYIFYKNYKYLVAVEPCTDCVEGMTVYKPIASVGEFLPEKYVKYRNELLTKNRVGSGFKGKDCKEEEVSILYISLGNINLEIDGTIINGSVDINTRTNISPKSLISISSQIKYDTDVFSEYAISNQSIHPSFSQDSLLV